MASKKTKKKAQKEGRGVIEPSSKTVRHEGSVQLFSEFLADPMISLALLVFALITLFLSVLEFAKVSSSLH